MKFGALLRTSAGEVPELQELFTAYKQLKKHLKRLPEKNALAGGAAAISEAEARALGATEADFVAALSADVARFNDMFLEREEDAVIRLRSLEDDAVASATAADLKDVYRRFVDFHGEMLLLVHWSILAYTGMVKILKKHHKRTGLLVRAPHLDNLAGQPFCSTELMSELVRKAESDIDVLRSRLAAIGTAPLASATSQSAALLQAARDKHGTADAAGLLAAASDSGSAPSGDDGGTSGEASDAETGRARAASGAAGGQSPDPSTASGSVPGGDGGAAASPGGRRKRRAAQLAAGAGGSGAVAAAAADGTGASPAADGGGPPAKQHRVSDAAAVKPHPAPASAGRQQPASSGSGSGNRTASAGGPGASTGAQAQRQAAAAAPIAAAMGPSGPSGSHDKRDAAQPAAVAAAATPIPGAAGALPQHRQQPLVRPPQQQSQGQPRPARILAQTQAALGLWKELTETASTPSTVLPVRRGPLPVQYAASSVTTDQSAA